ncbi:MAG TPA: polysaccharide deacetylase family protein [Gemmatimonadaceae bacterium]
MRAKELVFAGARRAGVLGLTRDSNWRRRRLLILCYHGVSTADEHEWNGELYVPPALLRERLRHLRENGYNLLPLAEACARLRSGSLPPRSVAITFDDGAVDFASSALPILREFNAPATVYLTTYYAENRLPVFDVVLSYVLWRGRHRRVDLSSVCGSPEAVFAQSPAERTSAFRAMFDFARAHGLNAREKDALVARVATLLGVPYGEIVASGLFQIMSPEVIATLPSDLIDVQLHTHRHRTPNDHGLFLRELQENADRIRALRGDVVNLAHFCYPSGVYEHAFLPWLREAGVQYATTTVPGLASPSDDPLLLPRMVDTTARSALAFEAWASGFAALLPRQPAHSYRGEQTADSSSGNR